VFDSPDAFDDFQTDAITVERRQNTSGATFEWTTIWSGYADLQEGGGYTYNTQQGAQEVADAMLDITASSLPDVQVGDRATRAADGKPFLVASTSIRTSLLPHLEIGLKRGGVSTEQK
jgi:hypothetical protein